MKSEVRLIAMTQPRLSNEIVRSMMSTEQFIAYCARVSNPSNQHNDNSEKLLRYCVKNKHWSIFEMVNVVFEINTTRDIARQVLRHRSFSFQEFCVAEGTMITTKLKNGRSKKTKIEDLYKRHGSDQYKNFSDNLLKVYDQKTKSFISAKIKEVFNTGIKPAFKITLENGKLLVCTNEHKILTFEDFKRLKDISKELDFVACNGVALHQDREWMKNAKSLSLEVGGGLDFIAELADIKHATVRKWLKKHELSFTRKEVSSYTRPWNEGLSNEHQPMFGKFHNKETRNKIAAATTKGSEHNLYVSGDYCSDDTLSWRRRVAQVCRGYKTEILTEQKYTCPISGVELNDKNSEIDHILPVYLRPDLAFEKSNLQVLHIDAHKIKSRRESEESRQTVKYSKIKSIEYVGDIQTYDIEVEHCDHNYIANGIITHNSQRYADPTDQEFVIREARLQDSKNRQNSVEIDDAELQKAWEIKQNQICFEAKLAYKWAIENGIAKEQARVVLPEGNTPSKLYMSGSLRSWIHYCQLRSGNGTQKEHREIAKPIWGLLCKEFGFLKELENE